MEVKLVSSRRLRCLLASLLSEGLSPDLHSLEQIRKIKRPTDVPDTGKECHIDHFHYFSIDIDQVFFVIYYGPIRTMKWTTGMRMTLVFHPYLVLT
jgi:hypothetical protein